MPRIRQRRTLTHGRKRILCPVGTGLGARWLGGCLLALALGLLPVTATAENVDGKFGLGFEEALTSIEARLSDVVPPVRASGLSLRYYYGNVALEAILGAGLHSGPEIPIQTDGGTAKGQPDMEWAGFLSLGVHYNLFRAPSVNFAIGVRWLTGIAHLNPSGSLHGSTNSGFTAEIPLRVEYFFNPSFAIAGALGPLLEFNDKTVNPLTGKAETFDFALTRGDFSGGIGFSYYFF